VLEPFDCYLIYLCATKIKLMSQLPRIQFNIKRSKEDFYNVLSHRIEEYFKNHGISKHANPSMVFKSIIVGALFVASYLLIYWSALPLWAVLSLYGLNGFCAAMIGFNISHDAVHGSYTSNKTINGLLGATFNLLGTSDYVWKIKHNVVHHTYTNIPDHDSDIEDVPLMRFSLEEPLKPIHRYQHIIMWFMYPFTSITWVFKNDYVNFFRKEWGGMKSPDHPKREYFRLFAFKILYYFMFLILPMLVLNWAWYIPIIGFVVLHAVEGLTLAIVFQMAHIVEGASFPTPDEVGKVEHSWAEHQLMTTVNFATRSWWANFLFGGLNFQIEHHLFPAICHIHYPKLAPIVKKTAREFGLPYNEFKTLWAAIGSHSRMMKALGRPETAMA